MLEKTKYVAKFKDGFKTLKKKDYYIFNKVAKYSIDYFNIVIPINEDEYKNIQIEMKDDATQTFNVLADLNVPKSNIIMYGGTNDIPSEIAGLLAIDSIKGMSLSDPIKLIANTNNKYVLMREYVEPVEILRYGINIIGTPKNVVVLRIRTDSFFKSDFYNKLKTA